jgi:erythromycin esterase
LKKAPGYNLESFTDLEPLFEQIKDDARYDLLGEASHGTSEFYTWRIEITKHLITENQFSFIAVEGDWPDCYNVNRYVKGRPDSGKSAYDVLYSFNRWPTWMWANREIVTLIEWLKEYNQDLPEDKKVGFYGLDVYSLWESMEAVIKYLQKVDPAAVKNAIDAYGCLEPYGKSAEEYARVTAFVPESCEDEIIDILIKLRDNAPRYTGSEKESKEEYFNAEQNATVAKNAELYYRKMIQGGSVTWNIRDTHMMDTLKRLIEFYGKEDSKSIVWAHNTHIGDARQTDMTDAQMVNIGQLVREFATEKRAMLVGFGTYRGTVIAGREWGENMQRMNVPPAVEGSWDSLLHELTGGANNLLIFKNSNSNKRNEQVEEKLDDHRRGQRAIGVVYNPEYEKYGNYVPTNLTRRYDAFMYLDKTTAVHPLHMPEQIDSDLPETYPYGL